MYGNDMDINGNFGDFTLKIFKFKENRGVHLIGVPTTLLAQVDSSIGGI